MKKAIFVLFVVACSALGFAQGENAQLRAEIQKLYRQVDAVIAKGDMPGLYRLMHPNYVMVDVKGNRMNLSEMKTMYDGMKNIVKEMKSKITVVHVQGDMREATAWISMEMVWLQRSGNRWVRQKVTSRMAETMVMSSTGWRFTYTQELPVNEPWPF